MSDAPSAHAASSVPAPLSAPLPAPFPAPFPTGRTGVLTRALLRMPHLATFLDSDLLFRPALLQFGDQPVTALAGKEGLPSAAGTRELALSHNLPYLALEDGFLRSLALPGRDAPTCSLIADSVGLFYDADHPSYLENLLNSSGWETPSLMADAERAMRAMLAARLSKYNHAPHASPYQLCTPSNRTRILVIDQWEGDPKVSSGKADAGTFRLMLEQAHKAHPGAAVFIKPHPLTLAGKKRGYLATLAAEYGTRVIEHDFSAPSLLAQADEVYTVSSLMGFEALLQGKPVHCFGVPFYAGWGLTRDRIPCPRRTRRRGVTEIFAAAYILSSRYVNPITGEACSIHEIIRLLAGQRRQNDANRGYAACLGFSGRAVRKTGYFLWSTNGNMQFFRDASSAVDEAAMRKKPSCPARVVVRASQEPGDLAARCAAAGLPLIRTAWGILRPPVENAGPLPLSLARDKQGMYYDASRPSELEHILSDSPQLNEPDMLARARALRESMLSLYARPFPEQDPEAAAMLEELDRADAVRGNRPLFVVAGQLVAAPRGKDSRVEGHEREEEILRFLRRKNPDALLARVVFGRPGRRARKWEPGPEDLHLRLPDPGPLLHRAARITALHTVDSLAGFYALLYGIPVNTWGTPFYAGWGLTDDALAFTRRTRVLTLDALVAGCLILYPSYYDWYSGQFCGPEEICHILTRPRPPLPLRERLVRWVQQNLFWRFRDNGLPL